MFVDIGDKIKGFAQTLFSISVVLYIIAGIAVFIAIGSFIGFIAGIAVIGLGILFSYLSVMFTYAFGSLVADIQEIKLKLNKINK